MNKANQFDKFGEGTFHEIYNTYTKVYIQIEWEQGIAYENMGLA